MCPKSIAAIVIAMSALTLSAQQWTEAAVLEKFLEQNPIVRESRARVAIVEAETRSRSAYSNPTISFSREGAGRTEFYQASQALPVTGRQGLIRQAGVIQGQSIEAEGAFTLWQARCGLRIAFYRMLSVQEKMLAISLALQDLGRVVKILVEREREGEGSKLDRIRAEREEQELRTELKMFDAMLAAERGSLLAFLPSSVRVESVSGELGVARARPEYASLIQRTLGARADIEYERKRVGQYQMEQRAAERLRYPEPMVNAGIKRAEIGVPQVVTGPVVGVSLSLPVFQRGKAEISKFAAEQERAKARVEILERRAQAMVESALRVLEIRQEALEAYAPSGKEMIEIAMIAYQEGEAGILELLDAYRMERVTRLRRIDLTILAREAWISLEQVVGEEVAK